jgi:hypothetical protein
LRLILAGVKPADFVILGTLLVVWLLSVVVYFDRLTLGHLVTPVVLPALMLTYVLWRRRRGVSQS